MLPQLAVGTAPQLAPGAECALLPADWLRRWRAFISNAGRRLPAGALSASVPELAPPSGLPEALQALMCHCHGHLLDYPPPDVCKRCASI